MKTCLPVVMLFVICALQVVRVEPAERDAGQPKGNAAAEVGRGECFVSVFEQPTGEPILIIDYPWRRHARPSVEVRTLDDTEVGNSLIRPLFFVSDIMKGKVTTGVYHYQDLCEDVPQTATFAEGDIDFEILAQRNSLERPSVCVACRSEPVNSPPEARVAFCLLDAWAVNERMLHLELPPEYFSQPGKIRVWLLRGKDIVWSETAAWPGTSEGVADVPSAAKR